MEKIALLLLIIIHGILATGDCISRSEVQDLLAKQEVRISQLESALRNVRQPNTSGSQRVYFAVQKTEERPKKGKDIAFDRILINLAGFTGGFDNNSMTTFEAPVPGSYRFMISNEADKICFIEVKVNDEVVQFFRHDAEDVGDPWSEATHVLQINLNKGDVVKLHLKDGDINVNSGERIYLTFIGELIYT